MPVRLAVPEVDSIGPFNRLSASQVNAYTTCPRLWYYEKVRRFKMPQIPVLFVGRAGGAVVFRRLCRPEKASMAAFLTAKHRVLVHLLLLSNVQPLQDAFLNR